jgi:hypothetical protein
MPPFSRLPEYFAVRDAAVTPLPAAERHTPLFCRHTPMLPLDAISAIISHYISRQYFAAICCHYYGHIITVILPRIIATIADYQPSIFFASLATPPRRFRQAIIYTPLCHYLSPFASH